MGQVTIYLEDDVAKKLRAAAKSVNISQSKWVAELIKEKIAKEWPKSIVQLAGAWNDLPLAEEIRNAKGNDVLREEL